MSQQVHQQAGKNANPTIWPYAMLPPLIPNAHPASLHVLVDDMSNLPKAARWHQCLAAELVSCVHSFCPW